MCSVAFMSLCHVRPGAFKKVRRRLWIISLDSLYLTEANELLAVYPTFILILKLYQTRAAVVHVVHH